MVVLSLNTILAEPFIDVLTISPISSFDATCTFMALLFLSRLTSPLIEVNSPMLANETLANKKTSDKYLKIFKISSLKNFRYC